MPEMKAIKCDDGAVRDKLCYSVKEASEVLGICAARVLQLRKKELLQGLSDGEKGSKSKLYFTVEDVERCKQIRNEPKPMKPLHKVSPK